MRHARQAVPAGLAAGSGAGGASAQEGPFWAWLSAARGVLAALLGSACFALARVGPPGGAPDDALLAVARPVAMVGAAWVIVGGLALACVGMPGTVGRLSRVVARRAIPVALHGAVGLGVLVASAGSAVAAPPLAGSSASAHHVAPASSASAHHVAPASSTDGDPAGPAATPSVGVRAGPAGWVAWASDVGREAAGRQSAATDARPAGPRADEGSREAAGHERAAAPGNRAGRVPHDRSAAHPTGPVVVRRGDTLWTIAARHLGTDATRSAVQAEWPRWWAANRTVIGADPDLLRPGQILRPPATP